MFLKWLLREAGNAARIAQVWRRRKRRRIVSPDSPIRRWKHSSIRRIASSPPRPAPHLAWLSLHRDAVPGVLRPGVTGFVNSLPLVLIEIRRFAAHIGNACFFIRNPYEDSGSRAAARSGGTCFV